jgi:xanthine dehydrogenase/oxidase
MLKLTTVEGVGNKAIGFNDIQTRVADYNASQCGWCTPGIFNFVLVLQEFRVNR